MAKLVDVGSIACYFESLSDPRQTSNRKHLLVDVVVTAVAAIVCGCDGVRSNNSSQLQLPRRTELVGLWPLAS